VEVDRSHPLSSALAELRRGQNFLRVPLRGLTAEEVQRMMASVSQREIPWPLGELVHRQTEGNPLFVQEMLRYLVEEGLVSEQGGSLRRVGDDSLAGRIPEGLRDVIGKRLSRLSEQTNQVLAVAAVMGREFRLDVLQRVAGVDEEALYAALAEAKAVAVVEERSAAGAVVTYRFTHAFFRQTLYEETIAPRRIRLHQQVARALEGVHGRRLEEHAAELAEHYAYSSDPTDLAKAVEYGELAAQRALSVYAYGEAERHLEQALKVQEVLDPDDKAKRCDLLLSLGETMLPGEDPGRVASTVAEAGFALAEELGDRNRAARASVLALEGLERQHPIVGGRDLEPVGLWVERANRSAVAGTREQILADVYMGTFSINLTGPASGHVYLRKAADAALQSDDPGAFYKATGLALIRLNAVQDRDRVRAIAEELLRRPRQGVSSGDLGICLYSAGEVLLEGGERDAAERVWTELKALAERTRDAAVRVRARLPDVRLSLLDGRLKEAMALHVAANALGAELGIQRGAAGLPNLALTWLGRDDEVAKLPVVINPRDRGGFAIAIWCLAHLGRHDEARALRDRFGDLGSETDETASFMLAYILEAAVLGGDADAARALERRLAGMARYPCVILTGLSWARLLGGAAALLGEREKARAYYAQAIEQCTRIRNRPELALAHLELAELLLNADPTKPAPTRPRGARPGLRRAPTGQMENDHAEALAHLDFAIAELGEMKMQPALERALRHKEVLKA
jgi:tetratricopeptide (TPR) repeat protein